MKKRKFIDPFIIVCTNFQTQGRKKKETYMYFDNDQEAFAAFNTLNSANSSQKQNENQVGVSRQAINSIETGKFIPSTLLALKMAKAFGTTVEDIFQLEKTDQQ